MLSTIAPGIFTKCQPRESNFPAGALADFTLPLGLLAFRIEDLPPGSGTPLIMHIPFATGFDKFYEYGPTTGDSSAHWCEFMYDPDSKTRAVIDSDTITIFL